MERQNSITVTTAGQGTNPTVAAHGSKLRYVALAGDEELINQLFIVQNRIEIFYEFYLEGFIHNFNETEIVELGYVCKGLFLDRRDFTGFKTAIFILIVISGNPGWWNTRRFHCKGDAIMARTLIE